MAQRIQAAIPLERDCRRMRTMLTALILICSLGTTPDLRACTRDNAVDAMPVPEAFANPVTCLMHSQAYLAETSLGRDLTENERVKVVCVRRAPLPTVAGSARP
jgi:hypothetical protein